MTIQRVGPRPKSMIQQAGIGFKFNGTAPTDTTPTFDSSGNLVFDEEAVADAGGLFVFNQPKPVAIHRIHINVPSGDVAGWTLYVTDGALDVEIESVTTTKTSYVAASTPLLLTRGESLKLVMAGVSAGIIKASVLANTIDEGSDVPKPVSTAYLDAIAAHAALTVGVHGITAFAATLLDDASAAAARTTLGVGALGAGYPGTWYSPGRTVVPNDDAYEERPIVGNQKVLGARVRAATVGGTAGVYFFDLRKNSTTYLNGTSVLSATVDLTALVAGTWTAAAVLADGTENLTDGDTLRAYLVSDNGDLAGYTDGVDVQVELGLR